MCISKNQNWIGIFHYDVSTSEPVPVELPLDSWRWMDCRPVDRGLFVPSLRQAAAVSSELCPVWLKNGSIDFIDCSARANPLCTQPPATGTANIVEQTASRCQ